MKILLYAAIIAVMSSSACAHGNTLYPDHGHGHDHELGHHHDGHTHLRPLNGGVYIIPSQPIITCNWYTESFISGNQIFYYTRDCNGLIVEQWVEFIHYYPHYHRY